MNTHDPRQDAFPLSPQQRARWGAAALPPTTLHLEVRGQLDLPALGEHLAALAARHEALRLRLYPVAGMQMPLQIVEEARRAPELLEVLTDRGAGLTGGGDAPISIAVESPTADLHRLRLHFPALGADRGTLVRIAQALLAPEVPVPDEEAMTYTQYSSWLYELQGDEDAGQGRAFWADQLPDGAQAAPLPYREGRRGEPSVMIPARLEAGAQFSQALDGFCRDSGFSLAEVLMTGWCVLLHRLDAGEAPALTMNWVHDCRDDYEEMADCWGLFTKALPLLWTQPSSGSFTDALRWLRDLCERGRDWQEYCAITCNPQMQALQYGFEWGGVLPQKTAGFSNSAAALTVLDIEAIPQAFGLLLVPEAVACETDAHGYRLNLYRDAANYSEQAALTLLEQYRSLLIDACTDPDKPLHALSVQSPSFDAALAALAPAIAGAGEPFVSLPSQFSQVARDNSGRLALCDAAKRFSYQEIETSSNRLAHHLYSLGIGREDRVALHLERSADMVVAMLAVLKCGAAFLPLDIEQPAQRIRSILEAARPALILSAVAGAAPDVPDIGTLDLGQAADWRDGPATAPTIVIRPEDAAYILHTSGSTGTPKGVIVEHRQLTSYVDSILKRLALAPGDRSAVVTSLAADLGYTLLFPALLSGGELHVVDKATAMDARAWAARQAVDPIDYLKIVPSLLDAWLSDADSASACLPWKGLILGGENCSPRLLDTIRTLAPSLTVHNHYGPTETTVGVLMHRVEAGIDYHRLPLSDRLDGICIHLLDGEWRPVAPGQSAELYIAGPQLARGYLDVQQTRERFIDNPLTGERLYRTGDLARYRHDGSIEILGRADRQVKIRGYRVELDEIERQLTNLPTVAQAAVESVPRGPLDQHLFAFVTLTSSQPATIAQLQGQIQDRLPDYMMPTLRVIDALPLTGNGKLDRRTLRQWAERVLDNVGGVPPRTPLESLLTQIWAEVLGLERVGIDDDFFALGGHSLAAVKLASRLQKALSVAVSVNTVFAAPSVSAFAALVHEQLQLSPLIMLSPASTRDDASAHAGNLFCFHPSTGHVQDYSVLVEPLSDWSLWGLQAAYLADDNVELAHHSIDSLASLYVEHIRRQQPTGPYHLLGWSLGGLLAIAAAAHLEQDGQEVAFLGIVDSQHQRQSSPETVDELLQSATQDLDRESQAIMRQLPPAARDDLTRKLHPLPPEQRLTALVQWARQQGLQLANDSWEHLEIRLRHHQRIQRLLMSFQSHGLNCAVHVWWASDTLAASDFSDPRWDRLNPATTNLAVIEGQHMTILQQPSLQQQLRTCLENLSLETSRHNGKRADIIDATGEMA